MSKQTLANETAAVVFLAFAIVGYVRDSSTLGLAFLVFAGAFLTFQFLVGRGE